MINFTLNHVARSVKDVDVAVDFYQKVLDLKEIKNRASNSSTRWLAIGGGKELHLIPRPESEIKTDKALHFALSTNDLDGFVKHLLDIGIDYSDWIGTANKDYVRKDGIQQVYFQDPDGYWVEVNDDVQ